MSFRKSPAGSTDAMAGKVEVNFGLLEMERFLPNCAHDGSLPCPSTIRKDFAWVSVFYLKALESSEYQNPLCQQRNQKGIERTEGIFSLLSLFPAISIHR